MTLNRWTRQVVKAALVCGGLLSAYPPTRLSAQDSAHVVLSDTSHEIKPINAFWRSLVLPGWGQALTHRNGTGAIFAAWEGVTMMMTLKAQGEANYLSRSSSPNVHAKRQEVQDWMVLWIFNHLFSGAEAFVSAHLQDFPRDLHLEAVPGGVGVVIPLGHR